METHVEHLRVTLEIVKKHNLVINQKKCDFGKDKIKYLGHIILVAGVQADPAKIESMVKWPIPKELNSLRGFLGLTGYYRRFVKKYSKIAAPLTDLLNKDGFKWSDHSQEAFEELKKAITTVPILAMPDFTKPFELETDASDTGIGAVLMQSKRLITYYSHVLSNRARQHSVYERELMAIVFEVKKWRHYLLGHRFVIKTDKKALKFLLEQRITDPDQQKWVSKLMGYKFEIQYKPGSENRAADALSKRGADLELKDFSVWQYDDLEEWDNEVQRDDKLTQIKQQILTGTAAPPGYNLRNGCLTHQGSSKKKSKKQVSGPSPNAGSDKTEGVEKEKHNGVTNSDSSRAKGG
ncbi:putative mitochondrial protein [Senna tora]|uniref:Putative mitochondrial protein n=1 Tax=Senna tora TaxID=362788 RepID=A0A834SDH4_9FABA|nr:putative mitochondrial protein [Senna tora]